jgi:predicted CXXCH cytochrome family protein
MAKRVAVLFMVLLFVGIFSFIVARAPSEAAAPRRIEVSMQPVGGLTRVTFSWEGAANIERLQVNADGSLIWLLRATNVTSYYEDLQNYKNFVFRVGSGTSWQEARVFPPKPSAHTNYSKNSDTCKGCHRTHYAVHNKLLSEKIIYELCITCHGRNGGTPNGSKYNVLDGKVRIGPNGSTDIVASPAGAFDAANTTSFHNVFREEAGTVFDAPGGSKRSLTCTDCHSAHVTPDSSPFRLLKLIGATVDAYAVTEGNSYRTEYRSHMNDFCSSCHEKYNYNNHHMTVWPDNKIRGTGIVASPVGSGIYRHPTDLNVKRWLEERNLNIALPLEKNSASVHRLSCITCHMAHGTTVGGTQKSPEGAVKLNKDGNLVGETTMLKRTGYMSVCMECHLDISYAE